MRPVVKPPGDPREVVLPVVKPPGDPREVVLPVVKPPVVTPKKTTPQSVPQYLQQTNYTPTKTELADIKTLFNAFGPSIFQMLKTGMTPAQILQYTEYGETPESIMDALGIAPSPEMAAAPEPASENPVYAAEGGSIDDLIEYLRR